MKQTLLQKVDQLQADLKLRDQEVRAKVEEVHRRDDRILKLEFELKGKEEKVQMITE